MYPQFSYMLALLLVIIAGVTVLIMLEMGNSGHQESSWASTQSIIGYLFLLLCAAMLAYMVFQVGSFQDDMPAPVMILALLLVPLIMIKVVVARQKAHISTKLILLGLAIFGLSFGLAAMAAYYYNQQRSGGKIISGAEQNAVSMEPGQVIMSKKCSKCHSLARIDTATVTDWTPTVSKMAARDPDNISSSEAGAIASYLNQLMVQKAEQGRQLVVNKCSICHSPDKVFRAAAANLDKQYWQQTVEMMIKLEGNPTYLTEEEKKLLINFLSSRLVNSSKTSTPHTSPDYPPMDGVRSLVIRKCSAGCHAADRYLRLEKPREAWIETINSMIEITGNPEYLSAEEKEQIINFLSLPPTQRENKQEEKRGVQPNSANADTPLLRVHSKCGRCHTLERIYQAKKSSEEWAETVNKMAQGTGNPNYLSEQEKKDIVTIISSWKMVE